VRRAPRVYEVRDILPCEKCGVHIRVMSEETTGYFEILSFCKENHWAQVQFERAQEKIWDDDFLLNSLAHPFYRYSIGYGVDPIIRNVES